jgi:hypothetical protein
MPADPNYTSAPYQWAFPRVQAVTGFQVKVDHRPGAPVLNVDHHDKAIRLRPGQTMLNAAGLITMATWRIIGGRLWVPSLNVRPTLVSVPDCGELIKNVVQLQSCPECKSSVRAL